MENALELSLRSQTSMMWTSTHEEERTTLRIQAVAERLGFTVFEWTCTDGFAKLSQGNLRPPGDGQCTNADQALRAVAEYRQAKSVFVFKDFDLLASRIENMPDYVMLVRRLKCLFGNLKTTGNAVVFLSSSPVMPADLKDYLTLIEAPLPDEEERLAIISAWIKTNCSNVPCDLDDESVHHLVGVSSGMTSRQIQSGLAKSTVKRRGLCASSVDDILDEKITVVRSSEVLEFVRLEETMDSIGGLGGIKDFLVKRSQAFSKAAARYGLPRAKGVLVVGPPGTGKSLMAKVTASVFKTALLRLDIGRLLGSLVGQSERLTRLALDLAGAQAPCVLWIDEVEKAFGSVGSPSGDSGVSQRQFGNVLYWMQEHTEPVFVVATANNIRQLPPEFLRKGRFDEIFFVDLPVPEERKEIMKVLLRKRGQDPKTLVTETLIGRTDRFTGAEMDYVITEALHQAFFDNQRRLSMKDLDEAATRIVPIADQMRAEIEQMRQWGKVNARPAS
jgi:SpoVK/Ycf46/Vps4 family AAA+-type ATPase